MIKLKDILFEQEVPDIFVPRRIGDRLERYINHFINNEIDNYDSVLDIQSNGLTELPEILRDLEIRGSFYCNHNNLTSLKNCPIFVGRIFNCSHNKLTSLIGAPEYVGRHFYCNRNNLTTLKGVPKKIYGTFLCNNNLLTNLNHCPTKVDGNFECEDNPAKFKIEDVKKVCDVGLKVYV